MRFVLALILVVVGAFVSLATSPGIEGIPALVGYVIGATLVGPTLIAGLFCIPKSGRNNKRFFRVFNVVLLFSILGYSTTLVEQLNVKPKAITDGSGLVEITVPGDFEAAEVTDPMLFNLKNRSGFLNVIMTWEYAGPNSLDLEHQAQLTANRFRNNEKFVEASELKPCSAGALECVYQTITMSFGEKGTITVQATLRGRDNFYSYIATTNPGLYDNYQDEIFEILGSVREP